MGVVATKRAIRDFTGVASNADIAVIYYSGHGIEVSGVNYLIPVDAKLADAFDVEDETLPLDRLMLATAGVKSLSLIILDACRENPFLRNGAGPGHARRDHPHADRAADRRQHADRLCRQGGLAVLRRRRAEQPVHDGAGPASSPSPASISASRSARCATTCWQATGRRQEPYVYGSLGGAAVSLAPAAEPETSPPIRSPRPPPTTPTPSAPARRKPGAPSSPRTARAAFMSNSRARSSTASPSPLPTRRRARVAPHANPDRRRDACPAAAPRRRRPAWPRCPPPPRSRPDPAPPRADPCAAETARLSASAQRRRSRRRRRFRART